MCLTKIDATHTTPHLGELFAFTTTKQRDLAKKILHCRLPPFRVMALVDRRPLIK
jgi:hypothetical protein